MNLLIAFAACESMYVLRIIWPGYGKDGLDFLRVDFNSMVGDDES
jgi:hypothetical protein